MTKRRMWQVVAVGAVMSMVISACTATTETVETSASGSTEVSATTTAPAAAGQCINPDRSNDEYIAIATFLGLANFFDGWRESLKNVENLLGVQTRMMGPADLDIDATRQALEQAIALKPAGILLQPWDPSLEATVKQALDAGIPVALLDADFPDSGRQVFVGTDNLGLGAQAADQIAEMLGGVGTVAVTRTLGLSNVEQMYEGFSNRMASAYPKIEIVADLDHSGDAAKAVQQLKATLQRFPDLGAIYANDGIAGTAVGQALRESDQVGEIRVVATDIDEVVLQSIKNGEIDITNWQLTNYLAPTYAIQALDASKYSCLQATGNDAMLGFDPTQNAIQTPILVVTKDNVDALLSGS